MPGTPFVGFQLILTIGRNTAEIATERRGIGRWRIKRSRCSLRREDDVTTGGGTVGHHTRNSRQLGIPLESHTDAESAGRVDMVVLILILRLFRPRTGTTVGRSYVLLPGVMLKCFDLRREPRLADVASVLPIGRTTDLTVLRFLLLHALIQKHGDLFLVRFAVVMQFRL